MPAVQGISYEKNDGFSGTCGRMLRDGEDETIDDLRMRVQTLVLLGEQRMFDERDVHVSEMEDVRYPPALRQREWGNRTQYHIEINIERQNSHFCIAYEKKSVHTLFSIYLDRLSHLVIFAYI